MSDEADQADMLQQAILDAAIKSASNHLLNTGNPSGICWSCEAETGTARRWCSVECRDSWDNDK